MEFKAYTERLNESVAGNIRNYIARLAFNNKLMVNVNHLTLAPDGKPLLFNIKSSTGITPPLEIMIPFYGKIKGRKYDMAWQLARYKVARDNTVSAVSFDTISKKLATEIMKSCGISVDTQKLPETDRDISITSLKYSFVK